jgi:hypothetical protein
MERNSPLPDLARDGGIDAEEVKALVNRWGREGFFRVKGWGDALTILSTRPLPFYVLSLETQYEHRASTVRTAPDEGGPVDYEGPPPDLWEVELDAPTAFESKRVEGIRIPHTESVVDCEPCRGRGRVDCLSCGGSGRALRGVKTERNCPQCAGRGWIAHAECGGRGRLRRSRVLISEFTHKHLEEKMFTVPLPQKLMDEAGREIVSDQLRKGGGFVSPDAHPELEPAFEDLWRQSAPTDGGATRILFQRFRIERIKGHEVVYRRPASINPQKFWIVGDQKRVYGLQAPRAWGRMLFVGIPAAAVSALLLVTLVSAVIAQWPRGLAGGPDSASASSSSGSDDRVRPVVMKVTPQDAKGKSDAPSSGVAVTEEGASGSDESPSSASARSNGEDAGSELDGTGSGSNDSREPDEEPLEESLTGMYDVLVGVFSDAEEAQEAANIAEEAAYPPTTTATRDSSLYIVSIKGFWSRDEAERARQELRERGITSQVRAASASEPTAPTPSTIRPRAIAPSTPTPVQAADETPEVEPGPDVAPDLNPTPDEEGEPDPDPSPDLAESP